MSTYGGSHRAPVLEDGTQPQSPWAVPAIGQPVGPAEPASAQDEPEPEFVVHAPRPAGALAPRATWRPPAPAPFVWVSAHGGAGSTSLARSSGMGLDLTGCWPSPQHGWPSTVAVVCRSNAAGLDAASKLLAEAASGQLGDLQVPVLVVVADAPSKTSRAIKTRVHEISGTVRDLVQVPWIDAWRGNPYTPDRAATAAAAKVAAFTNKESR